MNLAMLLAPCMGLLSNPEQAEAVKNDQSLWMTAFDESVLGCAYRNIHDKQSTMSPFKNPPAQGRALALTLPQRTATQSILIIRKNSTFSVTSNRTSASDLESFRAGAWIQKPWWQDCDASTFRRIQQPCPGPEPGTCSWRMGI